MNEEKLFKYLSFLRAECARHSYDGQITEDEINQLYIEVNRFKLLVKQSNLPDYFKLRIEEFNFDIEKIDNNQRPKFRWLLLFFGGSYSKSISDQEDLLSKFKKLSDDLENLEFELKSH